MAGYPKGNFTNRWSWSTQLRQASSKRTGTLDAQILVQRTPNE